MLMLINKNFEKNFILRELFKDDLKIIENWFEDNETKKRCGGLFPICDWYENVKALQNYKIIIASNENIIIGVVIFEIYEDKTSSIALLVSPSYRNNGYGRLIIREAVKVLDKNTEVHAYIEKDNISSIKCFSACGFIKNGIDDDGMINLSYSY